jgi:hypothetical protein
MAQASDHRLLTSPRIFLVGMAAFLILVGFVALILYKQILLAFSANPGLNGLIIGVLTIGSIRSRRRSPARESPSRDCSGRWRR